MLGVQMGENLYWWICRVLVWALTARIGRFRALCGLFVLCVVICMSELFLWPCRGYMVCFDYRGYSFCGIGRNLYLYKV